MRTISFDNRHNIWDHEKHLKRAAGKRGLFIAPDISYSRKIDLREVYTGDKVIVPGNRIGKVRLIDEDDTICVDIDDDADVLYEFDRKEVMLYKRPKKKKRR